MVGLTVVGLVVGLTVVGLVVGLTVVGLVVGFAVVGLAVGLAVAEHSDLSYQLWVPVPWPHPISYSYRLLGLRMHSPEACLIKNDLQAGRASQACLHPSTLIPCMTLYVLRELARPAVRE